MLPRVLLILVLLFCGNLYSADEVDAAVRIFDLPSGQAPQAVDQINQMFPAGADQVQIAEVGVTSVVLSRHNEMPNAQTLAGAIGDPSLGNHFLGETQNALVPNPVQQSAARPKYLPRASWRLKLIILRVVANGSIAAAIILLKDSVHGTEFEWGRSAANAIVHGGVNGFFQTFGYRVADFSYADWHRTRAFPNFAMSLNGLLYRTFLNSWPKRVLCTIASVLIYRLTDFAFTGDFDHSLATLAGIGMNIGAALAPAALGLEMAARMGPAHAEGLEPRNNRVFDLQNFTISVLFAAGLAANSTEMNQAFGIHGLWVPIYSTVAVGGAVWWATNSRWMNPDLLPARSLAKSAVLSGLQTCANLMGRAGKLMPGRWRDEE